MRTSTSKSRGRHGLELVVIQFLCFLTIFLTKSSNALSIERDEKDHNLDLIMPGKKKLNHLLIEGILRETSFRKEKKCVLYLIWFFINLNVSKD